MFTCHWRSTTVSENGSKSKNGSILLIIFTGNHRVAGCLQVIQGQEEESKMIMRMSVNPVDGRT